MIKWCSGCIDPLLAGVGPEGFQVDHGRPEAGSSVRNLCTTTAQS